ncbi:MAG TPA: stage II sporulation protein R [Firmicutes bacterium]|jgi:stage II sporulation protein R|nr:stage II sporulation protein R [Bacillota bacterium]
MKDCYYYIASKMMKMRHFFYRSALFRFTVIILIITGVFMIELHLPAFISANKAEERMEEIQPENIIRFHVKANSNSPEDQALKNYLAQTIINIYKPLWGGCSSIEELRSLLVKDRKTIEKTANAILIENGCAHTVKVSLDKGVFPARLYEGKLYPPGEYEALNMIIGKGAGENWWCVLFPPLCFNLLPSPSQKAGEDGGDSIESKDKQNLDLLKRGDGIKSGELRTEKNGEKGDHLKIKLRSWLWDTFFR